MRGGKRFGRNFDETEDTYLDAHKLARTPMSRVRAMRSIGWDGVLCRQPFSRSSVHLTSGLSPQTQVVDPSLIYQLGTAYRKRTDRMGETIKTISPSTRKPILERSCLSEADVDPLIQRSTEAFKRWRDTNLNERIEVIRKALKALEQKTDALSKELTEQMGRPIAFTSKEIITFLARAEYLLKISTEVLADSPGAPEAGFKRYLKRVPVGPVVIIFAWNVSPPIIFTLTGNFS